MAAREHLGCGYWSLSAYLKLRVKTAVNFIGEFEVSLSEDARRRQVDGIICGHIHHAADRMIGDVHYLNCGDWVESGTALVETHEGEMKIIRWNDAQRALRRELGDSRKLVAANQ